MRPLEIAVASANLPLLVLWLRLPNLPAWTRFLPLLALGLLALQMVLEGARWQFVPIYIVSVLLCALSVTPRTALVEPGRSWAILFLGVLVLSTVACVVLPVFKLPPPTGEHPVGTAIFHWVDTDREEEHILTTPRPNRELMVQIWYPAANLGPTCAYRQLQETSLKTRQLALVDTHASRGAPAAPSPSKFPIVIFSPSSNGCRHHNTVQTEELASHGFIVVAIDHPYGSSRVAFPDGRVVFADLEEFAPEEELQIRAADVRFVVDRLERLNKADPEGRLTDRIDVARVGVYGHSFGGAVAAEVCRTDHRVVAGINLDGRIYRDAIREGAKKPFLFLASDTPPPTAADLDDLRDIRASLAKSAGDYGTLHGASHVNFCDSPFYSPLKLITGAGPIRRERATQIVNDCVRSFFRKHMMNADTAFPPELSCPELTLERLP